LVGYDFEKDIFLMRNSWGTDWGDKGYFTIPMKYILDPDLCADLWTIQLVED
jgi:C1A family cysteine protease